MSVDEREDPVFLPRKGALILLTPLVAVPLVFLAWGVFLWTGTQGRVAEGEAVDLAFTACPEARPVLEARAADMGLVYTVTDREGGFVLHTQLPDEPESAALVPGSLSAPGVLEVRATDGAVLMRNDGVADASVRLDLTLNACTLLRLTPEASRAIEAHAKADIEGQVEYWIDGQKAAIGVHREMTIGELEIWPARDSDLANMHAAAAWAVALDHPLPCAVTR